MVNSQDKLRDRYSFRDFLFYTSLLAVPIFTAILAIFKHSFLSAIAFIVLAAGMTALILKFFCTRCPHYNCEGKRLQCIFFWGLPKFFNPRPGALNMVDKLVAFGAPAVLLVFPLYWLFKEPGLLVLYLLSLSGFGASIYRNECKRCIYYECPVNKVPEAIRNPPQESSE